MDIYRVLVIVLCLVVDSVVFEYSVKDLSAEFLHCEVILLFVICRTI